MKIYREAYKKNVIAIAKHHRRFCEGENCAVSLIVLLDMAERYGITFTKKEKEVFY